MDSTQNAPLDDARAYVRPWVQKLSYALLLAAGCLAIYLFVLWVAQFVSAVSTAYAALMDSPRLAKPTLCGAATRLLQLLPEHAQHCLTWIYLTDISTVSGFLLFHFFFGVTRGLWYCARGAAPLLLLPGAPFGCEHKTFWVQLGLVGTLVGFLLIGFGLDSSGEITAGPATVAILVQAFGTAILSTLVAVILAYILAPGVQWLLRCSVAGIASSRDGLHNGAMEAMVWLDRTVDSLKVAAKTLERSPESIRRTCQEVQEAITDPLSQLNRGMEKLCQRLHETEKRGDANATRLVVATKEGADQATQSIQNLTSEFEKVADMLATMGSNQIALMKAVHAQVDRDRAQIKVLMDEQKSICLTLDRIERRQESLLTRAQSQACRYVSGQGSPAPLGPDVNIPWTIRLIRFWGWLNGRAMP